jgi:hypothetical protein
MFPAAYLQDAAAFMTQLPFGYSHLHVILDMEEPGVGASCSTVIFIVAQGSYTEH